MTRYRTPAERAADLQERRAAHALVTDAAVVLDAAAAYLGARPRTVARTRTHLRGLGYAEPLCETAIEALLRMGYLDDAAYARAWVEARDRSRPRGEAALRLELGRQGVPQETIEAILLERRGEEPQGSTLPSGGVADADTLAARRLLERRRSALEREADPGRRRQKAYALLARNGFGPDVCREVSRAVLGAGTLAELAEDPDALS